MAADSAGQIGLDLVINKNGFDKQLAGIQKLATKAGKTLAAAFTIKKLVDFSKECIELGSDLAEVQNVVDVVFPHMNKQIDGFAKNAAKQFGLSETMAKKFTGTFGAMSKAFGFGEQQAYDMSTTLTGLAGDVASFYNISQDEAYTKLKSVFTGETESLKDLGVVMTQTALDSYALANGFGKTTAKMSEMEKVALRYQFVQDQLTAAVGDFSRTSDGWANQVRILKLQFDSLKATIGQGLINVLSPVIKVINTIIGKLMTLANAFKSFTELITGKKSSGGGVSAAASGMDAVAAAADKAGNATSGVGSAAKKAAKDLKGITTEIDELHIIDQSTDSSSGSDSGSAGAGSVDMGTLMDTSALDEADSKMQGLINRMKKLAALAKKGFWDGFGDTGVFQSIQSELQSIRGSVKQIFTAPEVLEAANKFADTVAYNLGKVAGSAVSIGATIADVLLGGFSRYLEQNSGRIQMWLISMFDIESSIATIAGNFASSIAEIFTVFRTDPAKQLVADLTAIFVNGFMGILQIVGSFAVDIADIFTTPIIQNSGKIQQALQTIIGTFQNVTSAISSIVSETVDGVVKLYNEHVHPLIMSIKDGLTEIVGAVLDAFNTYILPVLEEASAQFKDFAASTLQPLINKFLEFAGKVFDVIKILWEGILKPLVVWFVQVMGPIIGAILKEVIQAFGTFGSDIAKLIDVVLTVLNTAMDIVIKVINTLQTVISTVWGNISNTTKNIFTAIKTFLATTWNSILAVVSTIIRSVQSTISTVLTRIKSNWESMWSSVKVFVTNTWNNIMNAVASVLRSIQSTISSILSAIQTTWNAAWEKVRSFVSDIFENIKSAITGKMDSVRDGISTSLNKIKSTWESVWNSVKSSTSNIFGGIWSVIKQSINNIISGVERMANGVIKGINSMINALNKLSFDVPDWVPEIGGKKFGLKIGKVPTVSIPRLAEGGFVRANTPQLAMIGDNRHQGEIVAPEDKMQAMVDRAVSLASGQNMTDQYLLLMIDLLKRIIEVIEKLDLTVKIDIRDIRNALNELEKRSGYKLRTT